VPAVMRLLMAVGLLHGNARTITGKTIAEQIRTEVPERNHPVLRTIANPVRPRGGYAVLRGSLAPEGAVMKIANETRMRLKGPARCFNSEREAASAVRNGQIRA